MTQIIVAMNKLEKMDYDQERYEELKEKISGLLKRVGYKPADTYFIPLSGLEGENLTSRAKDERLTSWYGTDNMCLLEILDQMRLPNRTY